MQCRLAFYASAFPAANRLQCAPHSCNDARITTSDPTMSIANATPLIALDAVVLDTETTGLDPAKARIVEIGAVPLRRGRLDETAALRRLVDPGEPIPADATRIHAIDDSSVASAPNFAAVWPDI